MTKQEYMDQLKEKLKIFDDELAKEIVDDYESHFHDGNANGRSEEEICEELGTIDEVVEELKQLYQPKQKQESGNKNKSSFSFNVGDIINDTLNKAGNFADTIIKEIKSGDALNKAGNFADSIAKGIKDGINKTVYATHPKDDEVEVERMKENTETCKRAVIDAGCADVTVDYSENQEFHIEYFNHGNMKEQMLYHFYGEQKGDTFHGRIVKEEGKSGFFQKMSSPDIEINIKVPKGFEFIEIQTSSGEVRAEHLNIGEMRVVTASGDIIQEEIEITRCQLESASGEVKIKGMKAKILQFNTKSGDIILENCVSENGDFRSLSGEVQGKEIHILNFEASTASGDNRFEKVIADTVHLSSKSGDVFLENSTVKEVRANSVSGDAEIENVIAEKLYITSVSGDTEIRAKSNSIQAQSTSGDIGVVAEGNIVGSFQVVSGNIDLEIDNNGEGYVAEMNVMSGDTSLKCKEEKRYGCNRGTFTIGEGKSKVSINSMSGDVTIRSE